MSLGEPVDVSEAQDGGILKVLKVPGPDPDDRPWTGDRVTVHYTGTLEADGSKFDSSVDRGEKFQFNLGKQEVIKGWDQGVATMARGETAVFTITSKYAYGEMGSAPKIPGNATLVFEVQLFDFEGEDITKDKDKGITKRIRQAGQGFDQPNDGGLATVDIIGYHNKREFDNRSDLTFVMGEGRDHNLPSGLETALEKMKRNEKAHITLNPKYNFGKLGCPTFGIQPNDQFSLTYEVYLKSFERAKEGWQMSGDEKLEQSQLYKDKGTEFFKLNKIDMAANKYRKVIDLLEHEISLKGEKEESRRTMLQAGRMNLTMCLLKSGDWIEARDLCEKVLAENENVPKAYFRRGEANIQLNDLDAAIEDFKDCLEIDPENKAAKNKIVQCKQLIKNKRDKEKKTYAKMFDRFAEADARKEAERKRNEKPVVINDWGTNSNKGTNGMESLQVTGDVQMNLDIDREIEKQQDIELAEETMQSLESKSSS